MGMSASQARLLTLTARMSDLELQAQQVTNRKIRLATDSQSIAEKYSDALNNKKLVFNKTNTSVTANNLTAYSEGSLEAQRILKTSAGQVLVPRNIKEVYDSSSNLANFLAQLNLGSSPTVTYPDLSALAYIRTNDDFSYNAGERLYVIKDNQGRVVLPDDMADLYEYCLSCATNANSWQNTPIGFWAVLLEGSDGQLGPNPGVLNFSNMVCTPEGEYLAEYYSDLFLEIQENGYVRESEINADYDSTDWLAENFDKLSFEIYQGQINGTTTVMNPDGSTNAWNGTFAPADLEPSFEYPEPTPEIKYYTNLYNAIVAAGGCTTVSDQSLLNNSSWLFDQLSSGNLFVEKWDANAGAAGTGGFQSISYGTDTLLIEELDTSDDAAAEAEYQAQTSKIQVKDKKLDNDLKQIETEHKSLETEYDSVKKVIEKNIERSFKIFG